MKTPILLLLIQIALIAPAQRQKQVWLGDLQRTHLAENKNIVRVYFDKRGNLYPAPESLIPFKQFFDPNKTHKWWKNSFERGNLEAFYTTRHDKLEKLAAHYPPADYPLKTGRDSFLYLQNLLTAEKVNAIKELLTTTGSKTLIVFIHGFNDSDPTGDYQQLRDAIRNEGYADDKTVYLEIYWDGMTANQAKPEREQIWGQALQNSAYVSLGLRNFLQKLPQEVNLRIISHSLGAGIATGVVFNTIGKWKKIKAQLGRFKHWEYIDSVKLRPTPTNDIRIGMIAPAIPGVTTFQDFNLRGKDTISPTDNNIKRIVIGYNENDYAVTKRRGKSDYYSSRFGSTTLGCNRMTKGRKEIDASIEVLDKLGFKNIIQATGFTQCPDTKLWEEHGLYYYLMNTTATKEFLKKLFE